MSFLIPRSHNHWSIQSPALDTGIQARDPGDGESSRERDRAGPENSFAEDNRGANTEPGAFQESYSNLQNKAQQQHEIIRDSGLPFQSVVLCPGDKAAQDQTNHPNIALPVTLPQGRISPALKIQGWNMVLRWGKAKYFGLCKWELFPLRVHLPNWTQTYLGGLKRFKWSCL